MSAPKLPTASLGLSQREQTMKNVHGCFHIASTTVSYGSRIVA
jgi:hypothetical protein